MRWSAIDLEAGVWTKAFQFRKRKPTDAHQLPHLVPLAPMTMVILRHLKDDHERERVRKNAEYGGTWNGKKYGRLAARGHLGLGLSEPDGSRERDGELLRQGGRGDAGTGQGRGFRSARSPPHGVDLGQRDMSECVGRPPARP